MIPLMIGPAEKAALLALKAYAKEHPMTYDEVQRLANVAIDKAPVHLHEEKHYVHLPVAFEVGLTYEEQRTAEGAPAWLWHASFSIKVPGRVMNPIAIEYILKEMELPELKQMVGMEMFGEVANIWFEDADRPQTVTE